MRRTSLLLTLALSLTASLTYAENWPAWRGPRGDGISQEKNLLETWPANGPKQLWAANVGGGYSTPIAADGKLYFFGLKNDLDTLTSLDAASGKVLWTQSYGKGGPVNFPGTRATPTLDGPALYAFGALGDLICANAADGKEVWRINVLKETKAKNMNWGTASSPLVVGDEIIVQGGEGGPIALAVNKKTGAIVWLASATGKSSYAAPILITVDDVKQAVIFAADGAHALDPATGKQIWFAEFKTKTPVHASTPIYHDHHLFISAEYGHGAQVLKLTATSAEKLWPADNNSLQAKFPSAILDGGVLYVNSSGTLKCVTWPDCQPKWEDKSLKLGAGGSFIRFDEKLISLGEGGTASLVKATADGCTKISQFDAFPKGKEIWSAPLIYSGKLYLHGGDELKCYDIAAK